MEVNRRALIISICSILVFCSYIYAQDYAVTDDSYQDPLENVAPITTPTTLEDPDYDNSDSPTDQPRKEAYSVSQYIGGNFSEGAYYIEGYVVNIYKCQQCGDAGYCPPCKPANIIVSDDNKRLDSYKDMGGSDLMIYIRDPKIFKVGNRYRFYVRVLTTQSTPQNIYDVQLVDSEYLQ